MWIIHNSISFTLLGAITYKCCKLLSLFGDIFFCVQRDAIRNIKEKSRKEEEGIVKSRHILEDDTRQIEITLKENKDMADAAVK